MFSIIEGISDPSRKVVGVLHRRLRVCNSVFIKITASPAVCRQTLLKMLLHFFLAGSIFLYYQTCSKKTQGEQRDFHDFSYSHYFSTSMNSIKLQQCQYLRILRKV